MPHAGVYLSAGAVLATAYILKRNQLTGGRSAHRYYIYTKYYNIPESHMTWGQRRLHWLGSMINRVNPQMYFPNFVARDRTRIV